MDGSEEAPADPLQAPTVGGAAFLFGNCTPPAVSAGGDRAGGARVELAIVGEEAAHQLRAPLTAPTRLRAGFLARLGQAGGMAAEEARRRAAAESLKQLVPC